MIWFTLALFVVSFIVTALLTPKPKFENARPQELKDVAFPRATENAPIPLILGRVRMDAPNTIWYGDFKTVAIQEKVKTGLFSSTKVTVGHKYYLGLDLALGMGPNIVLREIYMDDKLAWSGVTSGAGATPVVIDQPSFWGGHKEGGGFVGGGNFYSGALNLTDQPVDSYLESQVGAGNVPAYLGTAHWVVNQAYIGESAQLRKMAFVLECYTNSLGLSNSGKIGIDMNPAEAIYQIMTDTWRGMGVDPAKIDVTSLQDIGEVLYTEGNGVSVVVTAETTGESLVQEIMRQIDGIAYQDPDNGLITFKLIRDDYEIADLPIYDEDDIVKITNFSRTSWDEVVAQVKVTFPQRDKESDAVAISQDMATVSMLGRLRSTTISFPMCYDKSLANQLASRERAQLSIPLFRMTIEMNRNAHSLRPGDVFRLNWPEYNLENLVMRVQEFDFGELVNNKIVVKCLQDSFAISQTVFAAPPDSGWVAPVVDPQPIAVSEIIEMPRFFQKRLEYPLSDGQAGVIPAALAPSTASSSYDFTAGIVTEEYDIRSPEYIPYPATGTVSVEYDRDNGFASGKDTTVGLTISNLAEEFSPADNDADKKTGENGLIYVSGEWMAFDSLTDNGNGSVTLRNLQRGLFGSQIKTHPVGTRVWQVTPEMFYDGSLDNLSELGTLFFKLIDRVGPQSLDLSEIAEGTKVMQDIADRPLRPRYLEIEGNRTDIVINTLEDQTLTWRPSNREVYEVTFEADDSEAPDQTEVYDIDVLIGGVKNNTLSQDDVSGTSYEIPFGLTAINNTDCEVRMWSKRSVGDLKSSTAYAWLTFSMSQVFEIGDPNHWDTYGGLTAAEFVSVYALRKRISSYSGPLIRVRDTNDDSEFDVYPDGNGDLGDASTVGEARVVTFYDQGDASLDLTQSDPTRQPLLDPTGAPNGKPCIDFAGGVYTLEGPSFSDASPNAHLIARPVWLFAGVGDTVSGYRYAAYIPHDGASHINPYYRMGILWEPDDGIETRWNGTVMTWNGSAASGVGNAALMFDAYSDTGIITTYHNENTPVDHVMTGAMTAPNTTRVMLGANPAYGEAWSGQLMELVFCQVAIDFAPLQEAMMDELIQEWFTSSYELPITNAGAETGDLTGWTNSGMSVLSADPNPKEGSYYFSGGTVGSSNAYQDFVVPAEAETDIDAGRGFMNFSWWQTSLAAQDQGNVEIDFLDGTDTLISGDTGSGLLAVSPDHVWLERTYDDLAIPANTRKIRVRMVTNRTSGTNNDAYFDQLSGSISWTAPL